MTFLEIEALIKRCLIKAGTDPDFVDKVYKSASPPRIATMVATNLWLNKVSEDEDTEELRHQLKHLATATSFDLDDRS